MILERLEPELNTGCMLWPGSATHDGYGRARIFGEIVAVHRYAWEQKHGPIPFGLECLHKCDTPACANDAHLFLGHQTDNMRDCRDKGRLNNNSPKGEACGASRLTEEDARMILALKGTMTQASIGALFGVRNTTVSAIHTRTNWRHL